MRRYTYCLQYTTPLVHSSVYLQLLQTCIAKNALSQAYRRHGILPVCAKLGALEQGYAQNGDLDAALSLFKQMPQRNVVSWTTMMAGIVECDACRGMSKTVIIGTLHGSGREV
ncbi:hypothetical protein SUGI_0479550 [Cryptomeria japonica]|nr:hypothetical protein SUGI_0479550 [Cryptomeria japonica]